MLRTMQKLAGGGKALIVCIGDSITEQNRHTRGTLNYVGRLHEKLIETYGRNMFVFNTGISGQSAAYMLDRLESDALRFRPDLVTVMTGMNDAALGAANIPAFRQQLLSIVGAIRGSGGEALLLTQNAIDPEASEKARLRSSYPQYIDAIRGVAASARVPLCDICKEWERQIGNRSAEHLQMMSDAIHPNERGHRFMARVLFDFLGLPP